MKPIIKQQVLESLEESINKLKQEKDYCLFDELTYSYDGDNYSLELYNNQYGSGAYSDKIACEYLRTKNMIVKNNGYINNIHKSKKIIKLKY